MKKWVIILVVFMLSTGVSFAAGGKNHGTKGKGTVSTGSGAQGTAKQSRPGR